MNLFGYLGIISILIYIFIRIFVNRNRSIMLSDSFYLGLCIYFIGSIIASNFIFPLSPVAPEIVKLSSFSIISSTIFFFLIKTNYKSDLKFNTNHKNHNLVSFLAILIILFNFSFSLIIFKEFFSNNFISSVLSGDLLYARKMISSSDNGYYFPGLVKQIRDILAPILILYFFLRYSSGQKTLIILLIISSILSIFFGGQRFPLVVLLFSIIMGINFRKNNKYSFFSNLSIRNIFFVFVGLITLVYINEFLGRSTYTGDSFNNFFSSGILQILYRIFAEVPVGNIIAYDFAIDQNYAVGELWINEIKNLMPGPSNNFSNELHSYLGGSYDGNAVLGLPFAAYLNFGILGAFLYPFLFLVMIHTIEKQIYTFNSPILHATRLIMLLFLPLAYDPALFLLNGGIVLIGFYFLEKLRFSLRTNSKI